PSPGGTGGRWLTPTTAGIAVAALAIGAAAVWFVERNPAQPPAHAGATASSGPTGGGASRSRSPLTPSPADSPSASTGPTADDAHETVRDPKGFTIAVPTGWAREESESGVFYRSPDRTSLLQVFRVSEAELSPLQAVQGASADLRARTSGYEEIRVGRVAGADDAAELVYEYDSAESHGRRRGVEQVSRTQDGGKWAVLTAGPAAEWAVTRQHHAAALEAFRPGG
ncbi:serine/arginine repetitive matrix protein 2, partial [Streptomyces sp. NPDC054845]